MNNIFLNFPEFIESDPRITRRTSARGGYNINSKLQYVRHATTIPADQIDGLSVLDLGCCAGATGAWVLANGASKYVGVEIESIYCDTAKKNLQKYFPEYNWKIVNQSFNDFFKSNTEKFDLVVAWGVLYNSVDFELFIEQLSSVTSQRLLIDSLVPNHIIKLKELCNTNNIDPDSLNLDRLELAELSNFDILSSNDYHGRLVKGAAVTLPFLTTVLNKHDFSLEYDFTDSLTESLKHEYVNRFSACFVNKKPAVPVTSYEQHYKHKPGWLTILKKPWAFSKEVSDDFVNHARHHIPNYDKVISKCVDLCRFWLGPHEKPKVIDVGCATGETLKKLYLAGFDNLYGVDSSTDMLDRAKEIVSTTTTLINNNRFPSELGPFDGIICNWTLHFIKDKEEYLTDMYNSLQPGGILIVTDKTYNSGVDLSLYHEFKKSQGVSPEEIQAKADSIKDIMFINSPEWYLDTLRKLGFGTVSIIDADFCFTSFLAIKSQVHK